MKYKVVFDLANNKFSYKYFIPYPFLSLSLAFYIYSEICNNFPVRIIVSLAFLIFSFFIWSLLTTAQMLADYKYVIKKYKNNECDIVEGCITNFTPMQRKSGNESFEVSGLRFVYPNASSKIGYNLFYKKGGYIQNNGQNVRITYAYDDMLGKDNVIVKLEIEDRN